MVEPSFQVVECTSPKCNLRFSTDLTSKSIDFCPKCGQRMRIIGMPYSNYRNDNTLPQKLDKEIFVVLDNLRSSLNVGSIFRSADGAGVAKIFCCGITPTPNQSSVQKSSLGAENNLEWSYYPNAKSLVDTLESQERMLIALESTQNSISLNSLTRDLLKSDKLTLVFGNEVSGVDPEILGSANLVVHIPMLGDKSSLNVAVSAGIALFAIRNFWNIL